MLSTIDYLSYSLKNSESKPSIASIVRFITLSKKQPVLYSCRKCLRLHDDLVVDVPPVDVMFINLLVFQLIFPANDTPIDGPYELLIVVPVDGS